MSTSRPLRGGEAHRRTNWNTEISGVAWTPDGRDIVYAVLEEPGLDQTLFRVRAIGNQLGAWRQGAPRECREPIDVQAAIGRVRQVGIHGRTN